MNKQSRAPSKKRTKRNRRKKRQKVGTMKVDAKVLLNGLRLAAKGAEARAYVPILSTVRLEATGDEITIRATDLKADIAVEFDCEGDLPACAVSPKTLIAALKGSKGAVDLELSPEAQLIISLPGGGSVRIATLSEKDYPAPITLPAGGHNGLSVDADPFTDTLADALLAASTDESRPGLNAVFFAGAEGWVLGTDGHRLHRCGGVPIKRAALLPRRAAALLASAIGAIKPDLVEIEHWGLPADGKGEGPKTATVARYTIQGATLTATLTAKCADAMFPPWAQVIPRPELLDRHVTVDADVFAGVLKAAIPFTPERNSTVTLRLNGAVRVETENADTGGKFGSDVPGGVYQGPGDEAEFKIGFNAQILIDSLAACEGKITIGFGAGLDPARIDDGSCRLAIVMPCRI